MEAFLLSERLKPALGGSHRQACGRFYGRNCRNAICLAQDDSRRVAFCSQTVVVLESECPSDVTAGRRFLACKTDPSRSPIVAFGAYHARNAGSLVEELCYGHMEGPPRASVHAV